MVIIVCALVSKSSKFNKRLSDLNRKFLAIETEIGRDISSCPSKKPSSYYDPRDFGHTLTKTRLNLRLVPVDL